MKMKQQIEIFHWLSNYTCRYISISLWWFSLPYPPSPISSIATSNIAIASKNIILRCVSHSSCSIAAGDVEKLHFSQFITSNETINIINSSEVCVFFISTSLRELSFIKMPENSSSDNDGDTFPFQSYTHRFASYRIVGTKWKLLCGEKEKMRYSRNELL